MNRLFILTLTCCLLAPSLQAQNINRNKLDSLFAILVENKVAMGGIAVSQNGKIIYEKYMGNDTIPANTETEYRLGSITKMFTAVMIFQLIEEQKLSLTTKLNQYFPDLPNADKITIGMMLRHRSGLANFTNNTNFDDWKARHKTQEELMALISARKTDFEPDAKSDYNNSNYLLLGYIIERITKKPYRAELNQRIISKIGLTKTYYGQSETLSKNECASYKYFNDKWIKDKAVWLDNFGGAGAIISTPGDMLKFINALFTYRLVNQTSLEQMKTIIDGYGMGMFPFGSKAHPGFGHNGKTEGFASSLTYYPDDKLAIAYCTNGEIYSKNDILDGIRAICFGEPYTLPNFNPIALNEKLLDTYTGNYSNPMSIKVVSVKKDGNLILRTMGQSFPVIAITPTKFWNKPYGFFFEFDQSGKMLYIEDVEVTYKLARE